MKRVPAFLIILSTAVLMASCHRSSKVMWEDTKTCNRYMKKGIQSLFGKHDGQRPIASIPKWEKEEPAFLTLNDDSRYQSSVSGMHDYPIAKDSPGDPGSPIPGIDNFATPAGKLAELFRNIHFDTDHYTVNGTENVETLHAIADHLIKNPNLYVFVEGHADERGPASYNLSLGSKRCNSVRGFLIEQGVNPDQLFTISYGKERPLVQNHDETSWAVNRRAQFKVYER